MDCGGFDPSDSDAVKGKGSERVGKGEREREREREGEREKERESEGERERERGRERGRPWEGGKADKSDRCCVDEIGESLLCTQWVSAGHGLVKGM